MPRPHKQNRLSPADLDYIRSHTDWQAVFHGLGLQRCPKRSKPDDWWALSPLRDEQVPSFHLHADGRWYDFGLGEGGGIIELIQRIHGGSCYQAARYLLDQGWCSEPPCEAVKKKTQNRVKQATKEGLNPTIRQDLLPMCQYHPYLETRGISEDTANALGIGYLATGRSPLKGRIVFQVRDYRKGKTVILSHLGRAVDDTEPKYLFYKDFQKAAELYGQDWLGRTEDSAEQIASHGLILTEGTFDVAKAYEAGWRNIVASFGARLSDVQAERIAKIAQDNPVTIAYDRDEAGKEGALRAQGMLLKRQLEARIFDWEQVLGRRGKMIPPHLVDLAVFSTAQFQWLRQHRLL